MTSFERVIWLPNLGLATAILVREGSKAASREAAREQGRSTTGAGGSITEHEAEFQCSAGAQQTAVSTGFPSLWLPLSFSSTSSLGHWRRTSLAVAMPAAVGHSCVKIPGPKSKVTKRLSIASCRRLDNLKCLVFQNCVKHLCLSCEVPAFNSMSFI